MKNESSWNKFFKLVTIIYGMIVAGVVFFVVASACLFDLPTTFAKWHEDYKQDIYRVNSDGSREKETLPIKIGNDTNRLVLETTLPKEIPEGTIFGISTQEEVRVFVDGELRTKFTSNDNPLPGAAVKAVFVQTRLSCEDAGKCVRIEKLATEGKNTGIDHICYGDTQGILEYHYQKSGLLFVISCMLMIVSLLMMVYAVMLFRKNEEWNALFSLGMAFFCTSFWLFCVNAMFQFVTTTYFLDGIWGFLVTMILPFPYMYYMNLQQKRRYQKGYALVSCLLVVDFVVMTTLHFTNTINFQRTQPVMNSIMGVCILYTLLTIVLDVIHKKTKGYKYVLMGMSGFCICSALEVLWINFMKERIIGGFMMLGLIIFLFMGVWQQFDIMRESRERAMIEAQANKVKSDFLANMSHEIRTPINAIMGMNELIMRENINKQVVDYAKNIQSASENLLSIINDILDFSKIESGMMDLVKTEYQLADVVNDVETMLSVRAKQKDLELVVCVQPSIPNRLFGDEGRLRQMMVNLLNNAIKYTAKGRVELKIIGDIKGEECLLTIAVMDTGIGIKEEELPNLFDKYKRLDLSKNQAVEGTGLGLTITKKMARLMNGEIKVESEYGVGSTFTLLVPQKIIDKEPIGNYKEKMHASKESIEPKRVAFSAKDAKILVVDDNKVNLSVVRGLLKDTKVQVTTVMSGQKMLDLVVEEHFDLIFLDHMMPGMDGMETLEKSKKLPSNQCRHTPVIALTANAIKGAKEVYLNAGFNDYLSKPVKGVELAETVRKYLPSSLVEFESEEDLKNDLLLLDREAALQYCGEDEEIYHMVSNIFASDEEKLRLQMVELYEKENWSDYEIMLHALKANAKNVGALKLEKEAKALEMAAKASDTVYIKEHHDLVMKHYKEVADAIRGR